ncbi:MAG: hypothetical protein ACKVP7_04950 [Hyphomicrobiaceae bacterium]
MRTTSSTSGSIGLNLLLGFIAAAIAVVTVHQGIVFVLTQIGLIKGTPWSLSPIKPWGMPQIVNSMFWGGLWGVLFAVIHDKLPGGAMWLKGLIFGLIITVISNWTLLPLIKGHVFGQPNQILFAGWDPTRMLATVLILTGFGIATGIIYGLIARR